MSLNLKAGNSVALGNYTVSLSEVAFSDADGQLTNAEGTTATIKVTNFFPAATNVEMPDTKIISGETAPLTLNLLESIAGCVGIQFDLALPDGFSLEKDNTGKEYVISANQASDITCNLTVVGNNVYRFMLYSNSLKEFVPGELMNLNLKVSEEKPYETYSVSIQDVMLSDNINDAVDYVDMINAVVNSFKSHQFSLIEKLAKHVADEIFKKFSKIISLSITIKKFPNDLSSYKFMSIGFSSTFERQ